MKNKNESSTKHLDQQDKDVDWKNKDDQYWKSVLTPLQYEVMRKSATEHPRTGFFETNTDEGQYFCSCCGSILFNSNSKFDSGCGWPSFSDVDKTGAIHYREDHSLGQIRIEVTCANCNAHLGHVFNDGPMPSKKRYCINSVCLGLKKSNSSK